LNLRQADHNQLSALLILAQLLLAGCTTSPPPTSPTIHRDIHGRIERSQAARVAFKREHPCPATHMPTGPCPGYIIDHVIALKRGGADNPANMQWQTVDEAKAKDRVE